VGLRGPNSVAWRLRQQLPEPPQSRAALRQEVALNRLQRLAHGTGLTIVSYEAARMRRPASLSSASSNASKA
jgi:hypothetical protein